MESPIIVGKPPEYGKGEADRGGFPFDEDESGAWSQLASRHPDIAARLRAQAQPQNWARKRRPQEGGEEFPGFFEEIPPEFRDHFPTHWNRRHGPEEQQHSQQGQPQSQPHPQQYQHQHSQPQQQYQQPPQQQNQPRQVTTATQTEPEPTPVGSQNQAADAERSQRSMSAPPDTNKMSGPPPQHDNAYDNHSNVRHIPIFVEGRDEPVISRNKTPTPGSDNRPPYQPLPPPHAEREQQYYPDDGHVNFHPPPNFSRAFGTPFGKGFRQGPQPFAQQRAYPQAAAFGRANSPQRSQSPKAQMHPEEHFIKVPVHHETAHKTEHAPSNAQQRQPQQQQQHQPPPQQAPPQPKPQPAANDPISIILAIQTDVLNLMSEVENFAGKKNDKQYLFLDEMLTRNLIKLDNIETEGKENIRLARKEAIKCIQKCIAVLEAKAEKNAQEALAADVEMHGTGDSQPATENSQATGENQPGNGETEMKETKEESQEATVTQAEPADTRPEEQKDPEPSKEEQKPETEKKTKKKIVKKRDKSKEAKEAEKKKLEAMQVDDKGQKEQAMEVDGGAVNK